MSAPVIRPRRDEDLAACVQALSGVHHTDGYPVHWPADPEHWLSPKAMLGAWVAASGPAVLGHVALTQPDETITEVVGIPPAKLAVVARLYVAVDARRGGVAFDLLDHAAKAATDEGLRAALEVDAAATGAIALYERSGWQFIRSGTGHWTAADGLPARVRFYLAPNA